jgi:hypothetical protein
MKSIKTFCKEHKNKIVFVGCMIGSAVIGALVYKQVNPVEEVVDPYAGKNVLSWKQINGFMNLEQAQEILDLNVGNNESYAILKEGRLDKDVYNCILISDNVITDKPEEA